MRMHGPIATRQLGTRECLQPKRRRQLRGKRCLLERDHQWSIGSQLLALSLSMSLAFQ